MKFDSESVPAHLNLGDAYRLLQRYADAKREFDWVVAHDASLPRCTTISRCSTSTRPASRHDGEDAGGRGDPRAEEVPGGALQVRERRLGRAAQPGQAEGGRDHRRRRRCGPASSRGSCGRRRLRALRRRGRSSICPRPAETPAHRRPRTAAPTERDATTRRNDNGKDMHDGPRAPGSADDRLERRSPGQEGRRRGVITLAEVTITGRIRSRSPRSTSAASPPSSPSPSCASPSSTASGRRSTRTPSDHSHSRLAAVTLAILSLLAAALDLFAVGSPGGTPNAWRA